MHRRFYVNAAARRAFLAGEAEGRAHDAQRSLVQVRLAADDRRVLAAHFGDAGARILAGCKRAVDVHAHIVGTGEGDAVDLVVGDQFLADGAAGAGDEVEDAVRHARVADALGQQPAAERGVRCRLEDHRVAGHQRAAAGSARQREGEVEGRDHHPDAVGLEDAGVVVLGRLLQHRPDEAVVAFHLVAVPADQVGSLLDIAQRFQAVLADLQRHGRADIHQAVADQISRAPHDGDTFLPGRRAPAGRGSARRGQCLGGLLARALLERAQQPVAVDGAAILEGLLSPAFLAVDEHRVVGSEIALDAFDGFVEGLVQLGVGGRKGGVGDLEFLCSHCVSPLKLIRDA